VIAAKAYKLLNTKGITNLTHGIFVRGYAGDQGESGMDELSICKAGTQVAKLQNGEISVFTLTAKDFGIDPISEESISPPAGMSKGDFSMGILQSRILCPASQMAAANAALLFYLAEKSDNLKECYRMAEKTLISGAAYERMLQVRKMLPA
jgi:anthranilate phosphoribosyltransferase